MHGFILTLALFSPGDPLLIQAARLGALESAIATATPPDECGSPGAWGHRQHAISLAKLAHGYIGHFFASPGTYQPFGPPGFGVGVDYLDKLISGSEQHFALSF